MNQFEERYIIKSMMRWDRYLDALTSTEGYTYNPIIEQMSSDIKEILFVILNVQNDTRTDERPDDKVE